eukprot:jgi/Ulvmu1/510/UM001_0518.1
MRPAPLLERTRIDLTKRATACASHHIRDVLPQLSSDSPHTPSLWKSGCVGHPDAAMRSEAGLLDWHRCGDSGRTSPPDQSLLCNCLCTALLLGATDSLGPFPASRWMCLAISAMTAVRAADESHALFQFLYRDFLGHQLPHLVLAELDRICRAHENILWPDFVQQLDSFQLRLDLPAGIG